MKDLQTIDEFISYMHSIFGKLDEFFEKNKAEEKLAKLLLNANDPDSRFKTNIVMQMISSMERIRLMDNYLYQPVSFEGILQQKTDGTVYLDENPVLEGSIVEYMIDGEWDIGRVVNDRETKRAMICDLMDAEDIKLNRIQQIKARVRLNA